jgi:p-aminobenzoyl-glutamate transporter AbgT
MTRTHMAVLLVLVGVWLVAQIVLPRLGVST